MKVSLNLNNMPVIQKSVSKISKNIKQTNVHHASNPVNNSAVKAGVMTASTILGIVATSKMSGIKTPKKISDKTFNRILSEQNYVKNENNDYVKNVKGEDLNKVYSKAYKSRNWNEIAKLELYNSPIKEEEMKGFKEFLELNKNKAFNHLTQRNYRGFDDFLTGYLALKRNGLMEQTKDLVSKNPAYHDLILTRLTSNDKFVVDMNMLLDYKINSHKDVNEYLRAIYDGQDVPEIKGILAHINGITRALDNEKPVSTGFTAYRVESLNGLKHINVVSGENEVLYNKMKEVQLNGQVDAKTLKELKEYVCSNKPIVDQPTFLSTSLDENIKNAKGLKHDVLWKLEIPKGTKGMYYEPANHNGAFAFENEFLVQRGSSIEIKDIDYDVENKQWILTGKVSTQNK